MAIRLPFFVSQALLIAVALVSAQLSVSFQPILILSIFTLEVEALSLVRYFQGLKKGSEKGNEVDASAESPTSVLEDKEKCKKKGIKKEKKQLTVPTSQ